MASTMINKHVVVIGGGTGSFTLLREFKNCFRKVTALVNMADNGGSTGVLRDEYGVLPPGDVRQCLVALSDAPDSLRELFNYRFPEGTSLAGHSFGNLFLSAVEMKEGDFNQAIELAESVLRIRGHVIPVTLDQCNLVLTTHKKKVVGESEIGGIDFTKLRDPDLSLSPTPILNPRAANTLDDADIVVIAPGNLYRSLIPTLLVPGVAERLQNLAVPVVYVANLVNKPRETSGFTVHDYIYELERFVGEDSIDHVLFNTDTPSAEIIDAYALEGETPVGRGVNDEKMNIIIEGNFLSHVHLKRDPNDTRILRSLIRHDAIAVCKAIEGIVNG